MSAAAPAAAGLFDCRDAYVRAHALYETSGFRRMGTLIDFYADGDGKAIFGRKL